MSYQRISGKFNENQLKKKCRLIGSIKNIDENQLVLDTKEREITVNIVNLRNNKLGLKKNQIIEAYGELLGESLLMLDGFNDLGDFDVELFNHVLERSLPVVNLY